MGIERLLKAYNMMPSARRKGLLIIATVVLIVLGFLIAPNGSRSPLPQNNGSKTVMLTNANSNCGTTKMRITAFGRSLMTYDWQSGNCTVAVAKPRKVIE
jgi:hypothetical protein